MNFQYTGLKFILLKVVLLVPFYFFNVASRKFLITYVACFLFLLDNTNLKALITCRWTSLATDGRKEFYISTLIFQKLLYSKIYHF